MAVPINLNPARMTPTSTAGLTRTKKFRIGIIGTGGIAEAHLQKYLEMPDVEIVAGADLVEGKAAAFFEKYGVKAEQFVDVKALMGDSSDNIPGVPGIGEKGACKLVRQWGTAENILANADRIGGKVGANIAEWGDKYAVAE